MNKTLRADLLLFLVALIWGATFPLVKKSLDYIGAYELVNARFIVATLFLFIFTFPLLKHTSKRLLWAGLVLGLLNAAVYLLQTFGMRSVDADTSAFISSVGVVFVPFLAPFFGLARVRRIEILGCFLCLLGLYILIGAHINAISLDEFLILLAAFFWAVSICYIQKATPTIKQPNLLAFYQVLFILPFSSLFSSTQTHQIEWSPILIFTILYTGILATGVVYLIQVRYQRETTATHAAIIYSLEPVLASIIAIYVNNQALTENIVMGGLIILASILLIELFPRFPLKWQSPHQKTQKGKDAKK